MDNKKPIRLLMTMSLILYGVYAVLYLVLFFGQELIAPVFVSGLPTEPFYYWPDLILMLFSGAARFLLFLLVKQFLDAKGGRSFALIGVFYLVLLVVAPVFLSHAYILVSNMVIGRFFGSNQMIGYSILRSATGYLATLSELSTLAAFAGCTLAWYRNRYIPLEEPVSQGGTYNEERRYD